MIFATPGGNQEMRGMFAGSDVIPRPGSFGGSWSNAGRRVIFDEAAGLPAMLRAIRLLSETIGMLPLDVQRDQADGLPVPERAAPQNRLLSQTPNDMQTPMMAWTYAVVSLLRGNCYILKRKARGRVEELFVMDPRLVTPRVVDGQIVYEIRENGRVVVLTRDDLIHIPGLLVDHPVIGCSIVQHAVHAFGGALGLEEYKNSFFAADATPPVVISGLPANYTTEQLREFRDSFEARHKGARNAHRLGVLKGDAQIHTLGITPQDADLISAMRFSVQDIGRITGVPAVLLDALDLPTRDSPEFENMRFITFGLAPWMHRLEQGLHADNDLFPDKSLRPRFRTDELLRADFRTRADSARMMRQAGLATANELRPQFNLGPHPDGDDLQATPVGGAPNAGQGDKPADPSPPSP